MIVYNSISTELGEMMVGVLDDEVCLLEFNEKNRIKLQFERLKKLFSVSIKEGQHILFDTVQDQLDRYFQGKLKTFDIPINIAGGEFRQRTWELLLTIPYGQTKTYGDLAVLHGDKNKVRAIGSANGANRIAIIVPCHRVIGADGSMIGYAGELWRKKKLLALEAEYSGRGLQLEMVF